MLWRRYGGIAVVEPRNSTYPSPRAQWFTELVSVAMIAAWILAWLVSVAVVSTLVGMPI